MTKRQCKMCYLIGLEKVLKCLQFAVCKATTEMTDPVNACIVILLNLKLRPCCKK